MKNSKLFLLCLLIIPWLTVPLLGKESFKKYLSSAIFMSLFTKTIDTFGERKKWWRFYKGISPFKSMTFFNFGVYFVASLWTLKIAYGKLSFYLIFNTILHILYTTLGLKYVERYRIFSLVKLEKIQYFIILYVRGILLYGFQYLLDLINSRFKSEKMSNQKY
jgi:hypothetical protein